MKKSTKIALIVCSCLLVVMVLVVTLLFTLVNSCKFIAMTPGALEDTAKTYISRMASQDPAKFIAHRGLSEEGYQNTEQAFLLAAQDDGVWGIETDVWMTSDGGMVCMHDANALDGISNVRDVTLEVATTTRLRNNHNEYAPSIYTYLGICRQYGKTAIVELKDKKMTHDDMDRLLEIIAESGADAKIISFHHDLLEYIRSQNAEIGMQALVVSGNLMTKKEIDRVIAMRCDLSSQYEYLTKSVINKFHDAGLKVGVWTVNNTRDAMCCIGKLGVDYVTSDKRMATEIENYIQHRFNINVPMPLFA